MTFRGTYKNGVVILDDICQLHEGQRVTIEPDAIPQSAAPSETPLPPTHHSFLHKLGELAKDMDIDDMGVQS